MKWERRVWSARLARAVARAARPRPPRAPRPAAAGVCSRGAKIGSSGVARRARRRDMSAKSVFVARCWQRCSGRPRAAMVLLAMSQHLGGARARALHVARPGRPDVKNLHRDHLPTICRPIHRCFTRQIGKKKQANIIVFARRRALAAATWAAHAQRAQSAGSNAPVMLVATWRYGRGCRCACAPRALFSFRERRRRADRKGAAMPKIFCLTVNEPAHHVDIDRA